MEERETEESIPFTIALNTIRYLGINPPKETRICTLKKTGHSGKKLRHHKELKSFHVHGLEEQILLKCLCKLEQSLHSMQSYSAIRKNEILPFAKMWMEPECIMLNEISQSEKDNIMISHLYVEFKKPNR